MFRETLTGEEQLGRDAVDAEERHLAGVGVRIDGHALVRGQHLLLRPGVSERQHDDVAGFQHVGRDVGPHFQDAPARLAAEREVPAEREPKVAAHAQKVCRVDGGKEGPHAGAVARDRGQRGVDDPQDVGLSCKIRK